MSVFIAVDGGYVAITLPTANYAHTIAAAADVNWDSLFSNIRWSAGYTCADQIHALQEANLEVIVGDTFADIYELEDLQALIVCKENDMQNDAVYTLQFLKRSSMMVSQSSSDAVE